MKLRVFGRRRRAAACDPVTEIDDELRRLAADLQHCQVRRERAMAARLLTAIDERLDARAVLLHPVLPAARRRSASTRTRLLGAPVARLIGDAADYVAGATTDTSVW